MIDRRLRRHAPRRPYGIVRGPASARGGSVSRTGSVHGRDAAELSEPAERPSARRENPGRGGRARSAHLLPDRRGGGRGASACVHAAVPDGRQPRHLPCLDVRARRGQRRVRRTDADERWRREPESGRGLPAGHRGGTGRPSRASAQLRNVDPGTHWRRRDAERAFLRAQPLPDSDARPRNVPPSGWRRR